MKELSRMTEKDARRLYGLAKLNARALNIHEVPPKRPAGSARAGSNVRDVSRVISSLRHLGSSYIKPRQRRRQRRWRDGFSDLIYRAWRPALSDPDYI